jgi:sporulation protein YlmC with PRC-barrel domain
MRNADSKGEQMAAGTREARSSYTAVVKRSILGAKVVNAEREDLGTIEDLVIDLTDNRIAYAILAFGGFLGLGDKNFAIPWEALSFDLSAKTAVLNIDKDRMKNAPGFDKDNWPDMADATWGKEVHSHYGYKPYWEDPNRDNPNQVSLSGTEAKR